MVVAVIVFVTGIIEVLMVYGSGVVVVTVSEGVVAALVVTVAAVVLCNVQMQTKN